MSAFLKQYKFTIFALFGIMLVYFILRLPNLTLQPIFADEAIYIRWAQVMRSEPTLRFVSLSDGKTPLFMWVMIPMFKIFDDPLLAGRLLSVISGLATLLGVFVLATRLFSLRVGLWSAFLYAITPFTVFFDRMALVDAMLAAFTVWSMVFAVWLLKSPRLDLAMILGYLLGGALLVKTPAMMNLLALPLTIIGYDFRKNDKKRLLKLLGLWMVALIIAITIYNILRLGPGFTQLSSRNADYVFSPTELLQKPIDPFKTHWRGVSEWFPVLLTWPILIACMYGIFTTFKKRNMVAISILLWVLVILLLQMFALKAFTARYILSIIPPLLIFAGFGIENFILLFKKSYFPIAVVILVLVCGLPLYNSVVLVSDEQPTNLPKTERRGYFEDWTAGYGLKEIATFLKEETKLSKNGQVVVGTEGSFGTLPDGLQIYLNQNFKVIVIGGTATISSQLKQSAKDQPTYFVANQSRFPKDSSGLEFIKEYTKALPLDPTNKQDAILLFKVKPE